MSEQKVIILEEDMLEILVSAMFFTGQQTNGLDIFADMIHKLFVTSYGKENGKEELFKIRERLPIVYDSTKFYSTLLLLCKGLIDTESKEEK